MAPVWYQDADTGELFQADELPSGYDIAGEPQIFDAPQDSQPLPDIADAPSAEPPGWLDTITTSLEKGIGNIAEGLGGGIKFAEDTLGTGTGLGQWIIDDERKYQAPREQLLAQVEQGSPQYYTGKVLEGMTGSLPLLATTGPAGALAVGGWQNLGSQYARQTEAGADPEAAVKSAILSGTIGAASSVPVAQAFQASGPLLQRMATSSLVSGATSVPQTIGQAYADAIAQQTPVKSYDLIQPLKENLITSALSGAAMPAVFSGVNAVRGMGKQIDAEALGARLKDRILNRPLPNEDAAVAPEPVQQALPDSPIEPVQSSGDTAVFTNVEFPSKPLPDPDPVVKVGPVVEAPSAEAESFAKPLDTAPEPAVKVQTNRARPQDEAKPVDAEIVNESPSDSYRQLNERAERGGIKRLTEAQQFFEGRVFGKDVPVVSRLLSALRKNSMPRTISNKFPEGADMYHKGGRAEVEGEAMVSQESTEILRPYFKADNPELVDATIGQLGELTKQFQREKSNAIRNYKEIMKRGQAILKGEIVLEGDPAQVRQAAENMVWDAQKQLSEIEAKGIPRITEADMRAEGFTDNDIQALLAHKDAMNYMLERLRETIKLQGRKIKGEENKKQYEADVDEWINGMRDTNYFPARRYGDSFAVIGTDKDGNTTYRSHHDSALEAKKVAAEQTKLRKGSKITIEEMPALDMDAFPDMPANLAEALKSFNPDKWTEAAKNRPVVGATRHLIEAQKIPGYSKNVRESTIDYVLAMSKYYGRHQAKAVLDDVISSMPEGSAIRGYATRYMDQLSRPESAPVKAILKFQNFMKLAAVPTSALINTSQTITTTIPKLEGELIKAYGAVGAAARTPKVWANVTAQAFGYLADRAGGKFGRALARRAAPEVYDFLDEAAKRGVLEPEGLRELYNHKQKIAGKPTAGDSLMFMFSTAEQANRVIALLAGREAGKAQGLKGDALFDYAKGFVTTTQFDQTVANRSPIMSHGVGRVITQYRPFQLNYLRFLRENTNRKDWPVVALSLGAMGALGGALALPFARDGERIAEDMGLSPVRSFRRFINDEKWADRILYGLPMDKGLSISGAVSPGEFMIDSNAKGGITKLFGPTADFVFNQIPKAMKVFKEQDDPLIAAEIAGPRFLRGPMKALRAATTPEGLLNYQDKAVLPDPTGGELAALSIGATPARLQKENEFLAEQYKLAARSRQKPKDYNSLIAEGIRNGDGDRVRQLIAEINQQNQLLSDEAKIQINASQILDEARRTPQILRDYKALPKKARGAQLGLLQEYGKIPKIPKRSPVEE